MLKQYLYAKTIKKIIDLALYIEFQISTLKGLHILQSFARNSDVIKSLKYFLKGRKNKTKQTNKYLYNYSHNFVMSANNSTLEVLVSNCT